MKKILFSAALVVATMMAVMSGCQSYKQVPYIQNSDSIDYALAKGLYDARIMPKDILSIYVSTPENNEVSKQFNLSARPNRGNYGDQSNSTQTYETIQRYLVSNEGMINFPILGTLYVKGMTVTELQEYIAGRLTGTYLQKKPVVTVEMANFRVTVIGEVAKSGVYSVDKGKINIFEALALAGDMTIYGRRDNVKVIREDGSGNKWVHELDLTRAETVTSPFYQLQQNDIVYVTPNKAKTKNSDIGSSTSLWFTSVSIVISLASLLYNILK